MAGAELDNLDRLTGQSFQRRHLLHRLSHGQESRFGESRRLSKDHVLSQRRDTVSLPNSRRHRRQAGPPHQHQLSPLGELFDHGMDSISVILVSNVTFICFGAGAEPGLMFVFCLVCNIGYYMSHWSAYITGKLQFASFDVTEGQFFSMATYFLTYLYGQEVWSVEIAFGVNPRHILFYAPLFLLFCRLIRDHMRRIIIGGVGPSGSTVAETSVLSPSTPLIFLLTLVIVIYGHRDSQLMSEYPILFTTMFGLCFSKISNKLILAHMSRSELEIWDRSWYSLVLLILNQYFNCVIPQLLLLWVSFIWIVADLIYYLTAVYIEIAEHFKIKILTIPGPKRE